MLHPKSQTASTMEKMWFISVRFGNHRRWKWLSEKIWKVYSLIDDSRLKPKNCLQPWYYLSQLVHSRTLNSLKTAASFWFHDTKANRSAANWKAISTSRSLLATFPQSSWRPGPIILSTFKGKFDILAGCFLYLIKCKERKWKGQTLFIGGTHTDLF